MKRIPLIRRGDDGLETETLIIAFGTWDKGFDYKIGDGYYEPLKAQTEEQAIYEALVLASAEGWREDKHRG